MLLLNIILKLYTLTRDSIMQSSFFDLENRYDQLSKLKDPLVELMMCVVKYRVHRVKQREGFHNIAE